MRMLSNIATIARGSVGNLTFTANQHHQIIVREKVTPADPNTSYQQKIRTGLTWAVQQWTLRSDAQRTAWDNYASGLLFPGPLGKYTLSGRSVYLGIMSLWRYLYLTSGAGLAPNHWPSPYPGFLGYKHLLVLPPDTAGTGFDIRMRNPNPEAIQFLGCISPEFTATRNRYKGPFLGASMMWYQASTNAYARLRFRGLNAGGIYFVKTRIISTHLYKRLGPIFYLRAIAETF